MKNAFQLKNNSTFEMIVDALDKGGVGFLAIIDEHEILKGIVTDGDIRRSILKKTYSIEAMLNKNPEVMQHLSPKREIISRLKTLHRRHMPLVDSEGYFKGVFTLDDVEFVTRKNTVVIMAGGLGSRLGELTKDTPKPMLSVGTKPMLQHSVELFSEQGFRNFIFCVNYKKEVIQDYFSDGAKFGVRIEYIEEKSRMGTAGALGLIKSRIDEPFFVINADVLTNLNFVDFLDFHCKSKSIASMCVKNYKHQVPFGVVNSEFGNKITSIKEKPELNFDINAGVYLLNPDVLINVPKDIFFDMPSLFQSLIEQEKKTSVYRIDDYWIDIGRKEDLERANTDLLRN